MKHSHPAAQAPVCCFALAAPLIVARNRTATSYVSSYPNCSSNRSYGSKVRSTPTHIPGCRAWHLQHAETCSWWTWKCSGRMLRCIIDWNHNTHIYIYTSYIYIHNILYTYYIWMLCEKFMHDTNYTNYLILDTRTIFLYVTVKIVGRGSCHPSTHLPRSHRTCGSATFPPGNPNMTSLTEIKYKPSYPFRVPIIICKQVGTQRESRGQRSGCTSGLLRRIATNMYNIYYLSSI